MASVPRIFASTSSVKMSATEPIDLCPREVRPSEVTIPGGFLSPMLQRVQSQVSQLLCLRMGKDRHHTAFVIEICRMSAF